MTHPPLDMHEKYMHLALNQGYQTLGQTASNPSVGCVIVKDNHIIGAGHTSPSGRPHAEVNAIESASSNTQGATLYVTLEPCCHYGKSPPCTDAIIAAQISHVVIACIDPNPLVAGKGIATLKEHGIKVTTNILTSHANQLHQGFFLSQTQQRPSVTLKLAFTEDGKIIAAQKGWFTNGLSRAVVHKLRAQHDAILVGRKTYQLDKPQLNCRLAGLEKTSPSAFIWSSHNKNEHQPLTPPAHFTHLHENSAKAVLNTLHQQGYTRLFLEGGLVTAQQFLESDYVDSIYIFTAHNAKGAKNAPNAKAIIAPYLTHFSTTEQRKLDDNSLSIYHR